MKEIEELRAMVGRIVAEAKGKRKKKDEVKPRDPHPSAYRHAEALDFSRPLGDSNPLRIQGQANFGPYTAAVSVPDGRMVEIVEEGAIPPGSAWTPIVEALRSASPRRNVWEAALHFYDHLGLGLGAQTSEGIAGKKEKISRKARKG